MSKIIGIGTDIVKISRMSEILNKSYKKRFLEKVLNQTEISKLNSTNSLK